VFRISGFKSAGSTVVPSHLSPADLAKTKVISVSRHRGLRLQESRMRFPSLGLFTKRQLQAIYVRRLLLQPSTAEADRFLLWSAIDYSWPQCLRETVWPRT
jgi:hypothetical protein